jgi:hypothetical protein
MVEVEKKGNENVCCPELKIVECGDTDEHCHLVCGWSVAILSRIVINEFCIGDFKKCIYQN